MAATINGTSNCPVDLAGFQLTVEQDMTDADAATSALGLVSFGNMTVCDGTSRRRNLLRAAHRDLTTIFYWYVSGQCKFCLPGRRRDLQALLVDDPVAQQELLDLLSVAFTEKVQDYTNGTCTDLTVGFEMVEDIPGSCT